MKTESLLIEIGCEELPVDYIRPALKQLSKQLETLFDQQRLPYETIHCEATPRRLVMTVTGLALKQNDVTKELSGPKKAIAMNADGTLTPAGLGFCKKAGLDPDQVEVKNDRLVALINEPGKDTSTLLPDMVHQVIKKTTFPKSMRWEHSGARFARPIRWLLVMLGNNLVPVSFADVNSNQATRLHPLVEFNQPTISVQADYLPSLHNGFVMLSIDQRRQRILTLLEQAAQAHHGRLVPDQALLDMVTMMTEWPGVVVGNIKPQFMQMPREIITTAMREHQRYFAVENDKQELMPLFMMIHDNPSGQASSMQRGCERVLEARLKDAEFFYHEDLKTPLEQRVGQLDRVRWIKGLGNLKDKTERLQRLSGWLADQMAPTCKETVLAAAHLCKADLITNMIQEKEFNKLQGFMGGLYARQQGVPEPVAQACQEHYLPRFAGDQLPTSTAGRILAMADRLDNLAGCWGAGFAPTGTKDPYALRRAAQSLITLTLVGEEHFSLTMALEEAIKNFEGVQQKTKLQHELKQFIQGRLETELANRHIPPDMIQAVLSVAWNDLLTVIQKAEALQQLRTSAQFNEAVTTFSRVVNILPKTTRQLIETGHQAFSVEPKLFQTEIELQLMNAHQAIAKEIADHAQHGSYQKAFETLSSLKNVIDQFFDQVMVMDKNEAIRENRVNLLTNIAGTIWSIADFSKIAMK